MMRHLLRSISRVHSRHLSTSPMSRNVCWPKPDYGVMEVQRSILLNGIKVSASRSLGASIASCTIMFQAGSRFEEDDELGMSHFIRACSTASGYGYSSFNKMRVLQQHGCGITCSTDRQSIAFTMRCPLVHFKEMKFYLLDMARCCYRQWEIDDRRSLIRDDLHRMTPEQRVLDLVQTACWAGPLANSTYCTEGRIDTINEQIMNCYATNHFMSDTLTVASVGIPFEETMKLAELVECGTIPPIPRCRTAISCPRAGFEYYDMGRNSDTWIAVAVPGCGTCDFGYLLKHNIVAAACGTHDIQSGQHDMDRTLMPPLGSIAGSDIYTQYRAFNISYQDTGVFGILAKTRACSAWNVTLAASEFLSNVCSLTCQQIEVGKARLKLNLAIHDEDCVLVSEGLALCGANGVKVDSARMSMGMIDCFSPDEISQVASALSCKSGQMAIAVVGDVGAVPHDRELTRHCR